MNLEKMREAIRRQRESRLRTCEVCGKHGETIELPAGYEAEGAPVCLGEVVCHTSLKASEIDARIRARRAAKLSAEPLSQKPTSCIDCGKSNEGGFSGRCKLCSHEEMKRCLHPHWDCSLDVCHSCGLGGKLRAVWEHEKKQSDPYTKCREADAMPLNVMRTAHGSLHTALASVRYAVTGKDDSPGVVAVGGNSLRECAEQMRRLLAEIEKLLERLR